MTPIGNPQNLLIAIQSGISLPFTTFIVHLTIPTMINLFLTYMILRIYFRKDLSAVDTAKTFQDKRLTMTTAAIPVDEEGVSLSLIKNSHLARISSVILLLTIVGFIISEFLHLLHIANIGLSVISLLGAGALYLLSGKDRKDIIKNVDYSVLVFFAAMFVVTSALWSSGAISTIMSHIPSPNPNNFVQSNTIIAGNLTILGAASNIIISDVAEARGLKSFTYFEFLKIGSLVTMVNIIIYYLFIVII
jgi:Na+/H+ antiporter NhaD/arsenite permease-like protein